MGTLGYMPLEQIRGDARPASDLYALGVTMLVAMAGRPVGDLPFDDATGKVSLGHALPAATPRALREALDSMIAPLLGQRAGSAKAVLSRLDAEEEPAPSPAPSSRTAAAVAMIAALASVAAGAALVMRRPDVDPPARLATTPAVVSPRAPVPVPVAPPSPLQTPRVPVWAAATRSPVDAQVPVAGKDSMVALKGGTYSMHGRKQVATVRPFSIDATEVTAEEYAACVRAGPCPANHPGEHTPDGVTFSPDPWCNFGVVGREDQPMNCVDWRQADAYCAWRKKRLPTDQEWEWAARGEERGTLYPWGDAEPGAQVCWKTAGQQGTCAVGSNPAGDAPGGIHDLAGNVLEWTAGEQSPGWSVLRGGGWSTVGADHIGASGWVTVVRPTRHDDTGFRCAR